MKNYIKNDIIKSRNSIIIKKGNIQYINPTEDVLLEDGWVEYIPEVEDQLSYKKSTYKIMQEILIKQWNERTDISNEEALDYMIIVYPWNKFIGTELPKGKIISHENKLWRVKQAHVALDTYMPSFNTSALFEVIEKEHSGEADDPIPYVQPMEILINKYYIEDSIKYLCIRDSGISLTHKLKDLVDVYVKCV